MKLKLIAAAVAVSLVACGEQAEEKTEAPAAALSLETVDQRLSYIVGTNIAKQFTRDGVELDVAALKEGVTDGLGDKESKLTEEQVQSTIATLQERAQARLEEERAEQEKVQAELAEKNKADGEAYLTENASKDGVVTTESGLQYKELVEGDGAKPTADDTVSVHYKGTLIDGTEFDSSYQRNQPATFPVTGVIPGWVEALQLMNVGDKWELTIPSDLAYGPGGTGGIIGPNATLIFEVELLDVIESESAQ